MRAGAAANFQLADLPEIVRLCHAAGARAYLAVNTIVYDPELAELYRLCDAARSAGVDACIAGDPAALEYLKQIGMSIHLTVQCNIANLPAVRFYARYADVVVLARELTLERIAAIVDGIRREKILGPSGELVKVEIFAHGALCVALSGRCYMSLAAYNRSANRGECLQNCRRRYLVRDAETGFELEIDNQYVMSPGDLCTVEQLDRILATGVSLLKIEGRGRPADYVAVTTRIYAAAVAAWKAGIFTAEKAKVWRAELEKVFNRSFWSGGYYCGEKIGEWSGGAGSRAGWKKSYLGKIVHFYAKISVAELQVETRTRIRPGDRLLVIGETTGALETVPSELRGDAGPVESAFRGDVVSFAVPGRVRCTDKVYLLTERNASPGKGLQE